MTRMPMRESGRMEMMTRMPRRESGRHPGKLSEEWPKLPKVLSLPPRVLKREVREMYGVFTETPNEFTPGPFGTLTATFVDGKEDRNGSMAAFLLSLAPGTETKTSTAYFETQILTVGEGGMVAVGIKTPARCSLHDTLPGWQPGTFGVHSDDGGIYFNDSTKYLDKFMAFAAGTVVGVGISSWSASKMDHSEVFITVNGAIVWKKKLAMPYTAGKMEGLIGCDRSNTHFVINKGQMPFVYSDLHSMKTV